ncbi:hypothetical protein GL263_04965 [Streptomyces durbertensis]|uniref:ARB-07466-like C-terminal domain-containing protein n=1 Tax=Streptomyces durbertensis TaxID=2448886 RepID=A0ABR6EC52_9ACTN|nr:hypothetical protein [Streptomyces durbertensis]MBB1242919.1 hypothetical protein [Streptomyces durbertensis]
MAEGGTGEQGGKRGGRLRVAAAVVVLLTLAGYAVVQVARDRLWEPDPYHCVVRGGEDDSPYHLEPQMLRNAATIEAVGSARGLPERAVTIALATAMQESMLRNIDYGDRDSVGLFQQRPSQGWGTVEQIMDPVYSAGKFYERLVEVPDYAGLPLTVAAQRVQLSAFPDEYAKHEPRAGQLAAALTGRRPAAVSCGGKRSEKPRPGDAGEVREKLVREFGPELRPTLVAGGAGRGAPGAGLSIPVRPVERGTEAAERRANAEPAASRGHGGGRDDDERAVVRRGWQLAHWAVANASRLGIERVAYADRVWEAGDTADPADRWRKTDGAKRSDVRLTLVRQISSVHPQE